MAAQARRAPGTTTSHMPEVPTGHGINPITKEPFSVIPAPGGSYHVYANNRRVFVSAHAPATEATPEGNPQADAHGQLPVTPDFKDSGYYADIEAAQGAVDTGNLEQDNSVAQALAAKQAALQALGTQQPRDEQSLRETNNNQGLFYSGHLGQGLADLASGYAAKRAGAEGAYRNAETSAAAARQALVNGQTQAQAAAAAAAAGRDISYDQTLADGGQLPTAAPPAVQAPSSVPKPPAAPRSPWAATAKARGSWAARGGL